MNNNIFSNLFIGIGFTFLISFSSCASLEGILNDINNSFVDVTQILDQTQLDLNANVGNFEQILRETIRKVNDTHIKEQLQNVLNGAIAMTGTEIRCTLQFTSDYLHKRIEAIKAEIHGTPPPPLQPTICNTIPTEINMNLPANQRLSVHLNGYFLNSPANNYQLYHIRNNGTKSNVTSSLSINSDFKLVINLGSSGTTITTSSSKLMLEHNGNLLSEITILQRQPVPCNTEQIRLNQLPSLVVYPKHKTSPWKNERGDKEFDGNGPCTRGSVRIFTRNQGKELWAVANIQMWECPDDMDKIRSDYTYGQDKRETLLSRAERGYRIKSIQTPTSTQFQNIDKNTGSDRRVDGSGPVASYIIVGDTSGSDIGESHVTINFRPIVVTLEEIGDCIPQ